MIADFVTNRLTEANPLEQSKYYINSNFKIFNHHILYLKVSKFNCFTNSIGVIENFQKYVNQTMLVYSIFDVSNPYFSARSYGVAAISPAS